MTEMQAARLAAAMAKAKMTADGNFSERLAIAPLDKPEGIPAPPDGWRCAIRVNGRFTEHESAPGYGTWWVKE